jgi:hypothetical protein
MISRLMLTLALASCTTPAGRVHGTVVAKNRPNQTQPNEDNVLLGLIDSNDDEHWHQLIDGLEGSFDFGTVPGGSYRLHLCGNVIQGGTILGAIDDIYDVSVDGDVDLEGLELDYYCVGHTC